MLVKERPVDHARPHLLEEIYRRHYAGLIGLVQREMNPKLAGRVQPHDVVQNAILKACKSWNEFRQPPDNPEAAVYVWLKMIVRNCLRDEWDRHTTAGRALHRDQELSDRSSILEQLGLVNPVTGPSTAAVRNEEKERLDKLLNQLKPADQEILRMIDIEGRPFTEAAQELQVTEGAARVRHTRAMRRLRDLCKEQYPEGLES